MLHIRKIVNVTAQEKFLFIYGVTISLFFWFLVQYIPLKYYFHLLQNKPNTQSPVKSEKLIPLINKTILRLKRSVPWKMNCLNEAITRKHLLSYNHIHSKIILSLIKDDDQILKAHAALIIEDRIPLNIVQNQRLVCIIN
jgi:hypothetical protein